MLKKFLLLFLFMNFALAKPLSIDLEEVDTIEALTILSKLAHKNVILSPLIRGKTTLHLTAVEAELAFAKLLEINGLVTSSKTNIATIMPIADLIKQQELNQKWQQLQMQQAELRPKYWQLHYRKAKTLQTFLQKNAVQLFSSRGSFYIDEQQNSLFVQDTGKQIAKMQQFLQQFDQPSPQIEIIARLVSIDKEKERELGIAYFTHAASLPIMSSMPSLALAKLATGSVLDMQLAALEKIGAVNLLSSPRLFTSNLQAASIESGEEIPYQQESESGGTTTTFKKAVLALKVTPQLLPKHQVLLKLEITEDEPTTSENQGPISIRTRRIVTNVVVKSGQTLVLGGIYEKSKSQHLRRIPLLSAVPILGALFKEDSMHASTRELLIFVTPTIMSHT